MNPRASSESICFFFSCFAAVVVAWLIGPRSTGLLTELLLTVMIYGVVTRLSGQQAREGYSSKAPAHRATQNKTHFARKASLIAELDRRRKAEAKLERSLSLIRATLEATTDGILVIRWDGEIDHFNERFVEMWRIPAAISDGKDSRQLMPYLKERLSDPGAYIISQATDAAGRSVSDFFEVLQLKDGQIFECYSIPQATDIHAGRVLSFRDVTVRTSQERKIARLTRIHSILSGINSAVIRAKEPRALFEEVCRIAVEQGGFMIAWVGTLRDDQAFEPIAWQESGAALASEQEATITGPIGHHLSRQAAEKKEILVCNDSEFDTRTQFVRKGVLLRGHRSSAALPLDVGSGLTAVQILYSDEAGFFDKEQVQLLHRLVDEITLALEYMEKDKRLSHLAYNDVLTGLPNRTLLNDRLTQAIAHADRNESALAVAFIDLDHFKFVNDSSGHGIGDQLLKAVAERLVSCVREGDTVARLGGDEFVMVLFARESVEITSHVMPRVIASLAQPYFIGGHELYITCSIGLSFHSKEERMDAETLLKNADLAMYRAKSTGRNCIQLYASEMNAEVTHRVSLEAKLRQALNRQEFELHYQPQVDLRTGHVSGMEALIRWQHPELGVILPGQFIPVAESTGLILPIGEWVLRVACMQNKSLQEAGLRSIPVSVNLSARQFKQTQMVKLVARILQETGLDPKYLELELTESVAMDNAKEVFAALRELRCIGIRISLDDFGTGYSSLSYLKRFPIDALKIDQAFINDITLDAHNVAIAQAIISLGHNLGLRVIAEGVATPEQALILRQLGCDQAQGYLYSQPISIEKMKQLLKENMLSRTARPDISPSIKLVS